MREVERQRSSVIHHRMALTTALLPVVFAATCALVLYQPWACVNALPLSDFYPFGTEHGDKSLPRGDDASAKLKLDHSLPFYGQLRNLITVHKVHTLN